MPFDFNRFKESARRFASGFSRGQKTVTALALVGVVLIAVVFMSLSGKPTYSMLFTNLQASDASAITVQLTADHVPYQLQDGGTTIMVPQNDVDQARLTAAAAGLPADTNDDGAPGQQDTQGLSILDKEGLTTSQITQQADYLQAIQGELEQTIDSIAGVTSTQVNVALPANQTYALGNSNPTGASVLVDLESGHSLTYDQVAAIVSLTSSSVPGLSRSDVTVADNSGDLLAGPGVNDDGAAQNSAQTALDSSIEAKVESYLSSVIGTNNSDVQVNTTVNLNKTSTSSNQILLGKNGKPVTACTSTDTSNEKYTGTGTPTGVQAGTTTGGDGNYTQGSTQQSCSVSSETTKTTVAPGAITQQSVAVLVNSKSLPKGVTVGSLKSGVEAAVGYDKARGDVLTLSAVPFKAVGSGAAKTTKASLLSTALKPGVALLLVLAILVLMWRASRRARKQAAANDAVLDSLVLDQLSPALHMDPPTGELPAIPFVPLNRRAGPSIQDIVDAQSDDVAAVLRDWLHQPS